MSINTSNINSVLNQIRQLQAQQNQPGQGAGMAPAQESGQFGELLADAIKGVNQTQQKAAAMSQDFASGKPGIELADVMMSLNQAQVSFKAMAEVRNRLVSSYQDIMNMPI